MIDYVEIVDDFELVAVVGSGLAGGADGDPADRRFPGCLGDHRRRQSVQPGGDLRHQSVVQRFVAVRLHRGTTAHDHLEPVVRQVRIQPVKLRDLHHDRAAFREKCLHCPLIPGRADPVFIRPLFQQRHEAAFDPFDRTHKYTCFFHIL